MRLFTAVTFRISKSEIILIFIPPINTYKMKKLILIASIFSIHFCSFGQQTDTSIFKTNFEKDVFLEYQNNKKIKYFNLLIALNYNASSTDIEKKINSFCIDLENKGIRKLKPKKQIKQIYDQVHDRFLKKYEEVAYFDDIFTTGNFNCVSASALYALILDYFDINYIIKETPTHVYIIADPSATSFLIETTLPSNGVFVFDEKFKKNYIDFLYNNKIISDSEFNATSTDALFKKHYESDKTIDPIKLAALQYYNQGVFLYNSGNYSSAASSLQKAEIVYPSSAIQFLYSNALLNLIAEQSGKKKYDGKTLAKYVNLNKTSHDALQTSKDHFNAVSNEMVINRPDIPAYLAFYSGFINQLCDSVDKSDYMQSYHEILSYYHYLKHDYLKVLDHASSAYELNPENLRTQQLVMESLMKYFQEESESENFTPDTLINYAERFPFILREDVFVKLLSYCFIGDISGYNSQVADADRNYALNKLQNFCIGINKRVDNFVIEKLYLESATTLINSYHFDEAQLLLEDGLELVESDLLKEQIQAAALKKKEFKDFVKSAYVQTPTQFITPPKYNDEEVYASVKKHITKCWNVDFYRKDGKTKETKVEQLTFIFHKDGKMKFKTGTEEHWGTWKLTASGPIITLKSNEDQQQFTILIYEATPTVIRGIMSPYKRDNKKIEFNSCK